MYMRSVCHIREKFLWERNMEKNYWIGTVRNRFMEKEHGKELLDWDGWIEEWIRKDE